MSDIDAQQQAVERARAQLGRDIDQLRVEAQSTMGQTAEKISWQALTTIAAVAAALVVRKALGAAWSAAAPSEPPQNPADPDTQWGEALAWTAATGMVVGMARMIGQRGAAGAWTKATGTLPPDHRKV